MSSPEEILDQLRAAQTVDEVNAVAKANAEAVAAIEADPAQRVRGLHIRNLAALRRREIRHDNV